MIAITLSRRVFIFINILIPILSYFTYRTIAKRFYPEIKEILKYILIVLTSLTILTYWMASLVNAGKVPEHLTTPKFAVPLKQELQKQLTQHCDRCERWRPPRAHHCEICRTCVFRWDHHSIILNNCVGIGNQKLVLQFALFGTLLGLVVLALDLTAFFIWSQDLRKYLVSTGIRLTFTKVIALLILLCSMTMVMVCGYLFYVMICSIRDNQTSNEYENELQGMSAPLETNLEQVLGRWGWWLPLPAATNCNYLEILYTKQHISSNSCYFEDMFNERSGQYFDQYKQYRC